MRKKQKILIFLMLLITILLVGCTGIDDIIPKVEQQEIYYFNAKSYPYWVNYPNNLIDGNPNTYALSGGDGLGLPFEDLYTLSGNNCSGMKIGSISKVEIRTRGRDNTGTIRLNLTARYNGVLSGETFSWSPSDYNNQYSPWYDITDDTNAPSVWTFRDVDNLDVRFAAYIPSGLTSHQVHASIVQIRITFNE